MHNRRSCLVRTKALCQDRVSVSKSSAVRCVNKCRCGCAGGAGVLRCQGRRAASYRVPVVHALQLLQPGTVGACSLLAVHA
jgi:hypothetical protein